MAGICLSLSLSSYRAASKCLARASSHGTWTSRVSVLIIKGRSCRLQLLVLLQKLPSITSAAFYLSKQGTYWAQVWREMKYTPPKDCTAKEHVEWWGLLCSHLWKHNLIVTQHYDFSLQALYLPYPLLFPTYVAIFLTWSIPTINSLHACNWKVECFRRKITQFL